MSHVRERNTSEHINREMIKYVASMVTFEEVPTEVTLSLSISNCQGKCPGCHSPELRCNIGTELTNEKLDELITKNSGISCVLLLGEGNDKEELRRVAERVRNHWKLRVALYSGRDTIEKDLCKFFDYVKIGSYQEKLGPLNKVTTNQRLYQFSPLFSDYSVLGKGWRDITNLFWK